MLSAYLTQTQALIQAPSSPIPLIPSATLTSYINTARAQLAADAECIRESAQLLLAANTQTYGFAAFTFPTNPAGVLSVLTVRIAHISPTGSPPYALIDIRPWEWFANYYLPGGITGPPTVLAQQGQGALGTLYFYPTPDAIYTLRFDTACLPIALVDDSTAEAIPYPWTDAVPFYAAWLAFQSNQRQADANLMMERYKMLAMRGRQESTPSALPGQLPGDLGTKLAASKTTLTQLPQGTR